MNISICKGLETENLFLQPKNPELVQQIKKEWNGSKYYIVIIIWYNPCV